ncbi:MgtC/SapB family protein [Marinobacter sp. X15-166B]|uniref:MgtC/SapB family protein n=1 Tax=Marinobacter sp. X15-166B TaxID=1897620 RepID=UPI00085BE727|nr:MgtC/SapB family protein [Marinobacter sp. X15-166B]OEY67664.1 magnesium transporter MgtC [Marinobacter sp. X15-166B]
MEIDLHLIWSHLYKIGIAFVLALPIAMNREYKANGAGLRTFPLVAISSCAFMLVGMDVYEGAEPEARIMYGIITGMGFIGGGSIIKTEGRAEGTATAAGLWLTGAIGLSVAYMRYEIALVLSFIGFLIFQFTGLIKNDRS